MTPDFIKEAEWNLGTEWKPEPRHLTWEYLADGIRDHVVEAVWSRDEDHLHRWLVRVESRDSLHGRVPDGYDDWLCLVAVDSQEQRAVLLGQRRYCCLKSAWRGVYGELERVDRSQPSWGTPLEDALPYLRATGF